MTLPSGAVAFSPQDAGGDDAIDSDVDSAGRTPPLNLEVGAVLDLDVGVWRDPLFADGFETGDTLRWTSTVP